MKEEKPSFWKELLFLMICPGAVYFRVQYSPERVKQKEEQERSLVRNFKMEITSGFWGAKTTLIQRDKPLTDEELELAYRTAKQTRVNL